MANMDCFRRKWTKVVWIDEYYLGYKQIYHPDERVFYINGELHIKYDTRDCYFSGKLPKENIVFMEYRDVINGNTKLSYDEFIAAIEKQIDKYEDKLVRFDTGNSIIKYRYRNELMGDIYTNIHVKPNNIYNMDCIEGLGAIKDKTIDFILTDIPYDACHGIKSGFREFNKGDADTLTFDLQEFLEECYRVSNGSICIFCGKEQFSSIFSYFSSKKGSTRLIVWEKTNPSPANGEYIYLSGVEMAVWFKKSGCGTFNPFCKNTVFTYSQGKSTYHPTQKNISLFEELILDNTKPGDIVLDPCMGSGTTAIAALNTDRKYIGFELNKDYCELASGRAKWSLYINFLDKFNNYYFKEE